MSSLEPEEKIFGEVTQNMNKTQIENQHKYDDYADVVNPSYDVFFCSFQCGCFKKIYKNGFIEYGSVSKTINPRGECPNMK